MKEKHNGVIGLWKFIYCLMIIILHYTVNAKSSIAFGFKGGSIGVEFFFIVSGYLLGKKALSTLKYENLGEETHKYLKKRIASIYPLYFLILLFTFIGFVIIKNYKTYQIINFIWDFLFLRNAGLKYSTLIYVGWYLSVLFIASLILYPLVLKYKKNFIHIIGPAIIIFVGGYVAYKWGGKLSWDGEYYTKCFLRGFFEMSIGVCLVNASDKLSKIDFTKLGRICLTALEALAFSSILVIANRPNSHLHYDYVCVLLLAIGIAIAFSKQSIACNLLSNKVVFYLEKLSLPMYLCQGFIIEMFLKLKILYFANDYVNLIIVILADVLFSILCMFLVRIGMPYKEKIKGLFVKEKTKVASI